MRNFQQQRGVWENIFHSWPVLIFLGLLVLVFAWGIVGFMGKLQITRENRKIAENRVAQLEEDKQKFSSNIEKLQTDEGVEETIREKFGLAKEGEGMIVIVEDKNSPKEEEKSSGGFFNFFRNLFK